MKPFRILLADDHPIFTLGVRSLLESHEGWEICGEAFDGRDALKKWRELKPDLVVLDISMPRLNGVDAACQILRGNPKQRILVLTDVDSEHVIRECLEAGVQGWVFKTDAAHDLTVAVEALEQHRSTFTSRVSEMVLDGYLRRPHAGPTVVMKKTLAPREREVLQLVAEGRSSKEISVMLGLAVKTVETHRSNILIKLKLHSTVELVMYAVRNGIVSVQIPEAELQDPHAGNGHSHFVVSA